MLFIKTIFTFLKNKEYRSLLYTTFIIILIGAFAYHYLEGWTYLDSFYFSVVTLTTIGYGDLAPKTDGGKIFTIIYIVLGIGVILNFLNTLQNHYSESRTKDNTKP